MTTWVVRIWGDAGVPHTTWELVDKSGHPILKLNEDDIESILNKVFDEEGNPK